MEIGDTVRVRAGNYTAAILDVWQNGNETWYTLDRDLGDGFRVSCEWPARKLEFVS